VPVPEPRRSFRRVARQLGDEVSSFQPRLSIALALSGALPPYTAGAIRVRLLRLGGLQIGRRTGVGGRLWVGGGPLPASRLVIGDDGFINDGCRFDVSAPIFIGNDVFIGHEVAIITSSHQLGGADRRAGANVAAAVRIERGAWVGARSTILDGVTIGEGAVIAAGAVVTRSVTPSTMVGGVPAKVLRELD
jgi:acetyltransferase-like isoleucine patch superfamily enzyme